MLLSLRFLCFNTCFILKFAPLLWFQALYTLYVVRFCVIICPDQFHLPLLILTSRYLLPLPLVPVFLCFPPITVESPFLFCFGAFACSSAFCFFLVLTFAVSLISCCFLWYWTSQALESVFGSACYPASTSMTRDVFVREPGQVQVKRKDYFSSTWGANKTHD